MESIARVRDALAFINPCDLSRDEWRNIGMALKSDGQHYEIFDQWCQKDPDRYDPEENLRQWDSWNGDGITINTLFYKAKENGFSTLEQPKTYLVPSAEESPVKQFKRFLTALYNPKEHVSICTAAKQDADKYHPAKRKNMSVRELTERCDFTDDMHAVIGDINSYAGAWIGINPVDSEGTKKSECHRLPLLSGGVRQ